MKHMEYTIKMRRWLGRVAAMAALCVSAGACDELLQVELPGQVTEEATFVPEQARLLVNSAIADVECGLSDFTAFEGAGFDDNTTRTVGWWGGRFERPVTPGTANCSTGETSVGWFTPLQKGRWMAEQVYGYLESDWTGLSDREELMGTAALYAGIVYTHYGEFFCEVMADQGPLMTWQEALAEGEAWFDKAITHINTAGDYSIATGVTTSALTMAHLLRARAQFKQDDASKNADILADLAAVPQGFESFITREGGAERTRWNRVYSAHTGLGWVVLLGPVYWWTGTSSNQPDYLGGGPWPATIPFTGYWDLAILPDGRAVTDAGFPITIDDAGSVADPRVQGVETTVGGIGGGTGPNDYQGWEQRKYTSQDADFPMAKWEEAWLTRAQIEGGQTAIDLVNEIRTAHGLPTVTYLTGASDPDDIKIMVLEEIRRTHFLEPGRWWSTKLHNDLWFPRGEGADIWNFGYQTGVRMVYPNNEFTLNPNLTTDDQGSACDPDQNPVT